MFVMMTVVTWSTAAEVEFVQASKRRQCDGVIRRTRRDGFVHVAASFAHEARA